MRRFECPACAAEVFVLSSRCVACGTDLVLDPSEPAFGDLEVVTGCVNRPHLSCNWAAGAGDVRCLACAMTRSGPGDLDGEVRAAWTRAERAKRRLVLQLIGLGLPCESDEAPIFDMHYSSDGSVTIGHADGVITLDVGEADDARRERLRERLDEPYRTLLGHIRHEVGHFYWPALVADSPTMLGGFRELFGDERADYSEALRRHYADGPPEDWRHDFVSAYATMHPWEDWAECFAHYLHIRDTLETAAAHDLALGDLRVAAVVAGGDAHLEPMLDLWLPLSVAINAVNRSMDQPDLYPFVTTMRIRSKLAFVHRAVSALAAMRLAGPGSSGGAAAERMPGSPLPRS